MTSIAILAKVSVAVILIVASAGKFSDLRAFGTTIGMFVSTRLPDTVVRTFALAIATLELLLGISSLATPSIKLFNVAILILTLGFVAVSIAGYMFRRGRPCRCFGALSTKNFNLLGIMRSCVLAVAAVTALIHVPLDSTDLGVTERALLLGLAGVVALASFSAARALAEAGASRSVVGGVG